MKLPPLRYRYFILICLLLLTLGFGIGFGFGFTKGSIQTMEWLIGKMGYFTHIEIDAKAITAGIFAYQNRVNECYPTIKPNITIKNGN